MASPDDRNSESESLPDTLSSVFAADRTNPHGLAVAKWTLRSDDPCLIDCIYYRDSQIERDDHRPHGTILCSNRAVSGFAGDYHLVPAVGENEFGAITLNSEAVGRSGYLLNASRDGQCLAQGLALTDPHDARSLLISWWTGSVRPYGIVKYTIHDRHSLKACYLSEMSPETPGRGTAIGNTLDGFPGTYALTYEEESGDTWGPFEWSLAARGDIIDLTWRLDGRIVCSGFGVVDPDTPSIIVNYVAVRD